MKHAKKSCQGKESPNLLQNHKDETILQTAGRKIVM